MMDLYGSSGGVLQDSANVVPETGQSALNTPILRAFPFLHTKTKAQGADSLAVLPLDRTMTSNTAR